MIVVQLILFCMIFTLMVAYSVRGGSINTLYFYPKPVQEETIQIGLIDRETVKDKKKKIYDLILFGNDSYFAVDNWFVESGV